MDKPRKTPAPAVVGTEELKHEDTKSQRHHRNRKSRGVVIGFVVSCRRVLVVKE